MTDRKLEPQTTALFDLERVSVKNFCAFLHANIPLVIAVSVMLFFTYGIKLFWYNIGIDTELFMADKPDFLIWHTQIGRFGLSLLSRLWYISEFNPWTAFFCGFCLIWFWTLSWCYVISIFKRNTGKNNNLIPFALLVQTSAVWAEQFYFVFQAAETSLIITLCPYVIYLFYKGFLNNETKATACAFILLVFMIAVYQAVVPLYCCGVFICFLLLQEHSDYRPEIYRRLCLRLFVSLAAAAAAYLFIDRIIIPYVFHIEKSDYVDNMNRWGTRSITENIRSILIFCYSVTIGHISLVGPFMARYARTGMKAVEFIANASRELGNALLLPAMVFFTAVILKKARSVLPPGRRVLYVLAALGVPVSFMLLTLAGGSSPPVRALWALPFASAFMIFYLIENSGGKRGFIITILALCTALYQGQITAQLLYSDQMRYNEDVCVAHELNTLLLQAQPEGETLPVAIVGNYRTASRFRANYITGEVLGHSFFDWGDKPKHWTERGLKFMRSLGMNFDTADEQLLEKAAQEALSMPSYPAPGWVKRLPDVIAVKFSEGGSVPYSRD